jgi:hypothetical protein
MSYVEEVMVKIQENPTSQDLDYFLEAHGRVGYLAAVAEGRAERAEAERKYAEATAYADAKRDGAKTAADATVAATITTKASKDAEIAARETATKIKNLLNSVEQVIHGIKFLGRQTDAPMTLPRR